MHRISICLALLAGFALAQECPAGKKECSPEGSCPTAKSTDCPISKSLATARKAIADAPKAEESLAADQRAELVKAREYLLKETSFGRSLAPTYEACAHLLVAAAAQEGTNPAAQAVLKEMCATYCSIAKSLGGCSEKECCDGAEDCCAKGTPAEMAKTAKDQAMKAKELLKTGKADFEKVTPEQMEKIGACMVAMEDCPRVAAVDGAIDALDEAFAALAKMGVPAEGAGVRDDLVRTAKALHTELNSCGSCDEECAEECEEECEECPAEAPQPGKSS